MECKDHAAAAWASLHTLHVLVIIIILQSDSSYGKTFFFFFFKFAPGADSGAT